MYLLPEPTESTYETIDRDFLFTLHLLLLIRHGASTWNLEHHLLGTVAWDRLDRGRAGTGTTFGKRLAYAPAQQHYQQSFGTCRPDYAYLSQGRALTIQHEPDLMDIDLGHWSGQNRDDLFHSDPAWKAFVRDPLVAPADVETFPEPKQRVVTAISRWLSQDTTGPLSAFVTHADVIKVLLAHYLGLQVGGPTFHSCLSSVRAEIS